MTRYTTLGEGKSTKILAVSGHTGPARTVTSCHADLADPIAWALQASYERFAAALYPVAVEADGTPVQARRILLDRFDQALADRTFLPRTDVWERADGLIARLANALDDAPAPVVAAVRRELGDHLDGFDGVLVPARASTQVNKRLWLDLVVSGAFAAMTETSWTSWVGPDSDLEVFEDDPVFPTGGPCIATWELIDLKEHFYDAAPDLTTWAAGFAMEDLARTAAADQEFVGFGIRVDHFVAWIRHHRPADLPRVCELLGASPAP